MKHHRGTAFTLIEILLALSLVVIVVTIVYGSYRATTNSMDQSKAALTRSQVGLAVLTTLTRQIRCLYVPPAGPSDNQKSPAAPGTQFEQNPDDFFLGGSFAPDGCLLKMITTAAILPDEGGNNGLYRVAYRMNGISGTLQYSQQPFLPVPNVFSAEPQWRTLAENVKSLTLAFKNDSQWVDRWKYRDQQSLPAAVKVTLTLADAQGATSDFTALAPVLCASRHTLQEVQSAPENPSIGPKGPTINEP